MAAHRQLLAEVMRNLGHPVPDEKVLMGALQKAFHDIKRKEGLDPDKVKYKLSLVPITENWVDETFDRASSATRD